MGAQLQKKDQVKDDRSHSKGQNFQTQILLKKDRLQKLPEKSYESDLKNVPRFTTLIRRHGISYSCTE